MNFSNNNLTVKELNSRKHFLDAVEIDNPQKNNAWSWIKLANLYLAKGRLLNYTYCISQARLNIDKAFKKETR